MNAPSQDRPLTDAEIGTLEERLAAIDPEDSLHRLPRPVGHHLPVGEREVRGGRHRFQVSLTFL